MKNGANEASMSRKDTKAKSTSKNQISIPEVSKQDIMIEDSNDYSPTTRSIKLIKCLNCNTNNKFELPLKQ
jgi:hypothetical protein